MKEFIMVVGPPASGKDTWIYKYISGKKNFVVCSSDDVREQLYGDAAEQGEPQEVFRVLHNQVIDNLDQGKNVVYNATNCTKRNRKTVLKIINEYKNYHKTCVILNTSLEQCLKNNKKRQNQGGRFVPEWVIKKIANSIQQPELQEGFDEIQFIDFKEE